MEHRPLMHRAGIIQSANLPVYKFTMSLINTYWATQMLNKIRKVLEWSVFAGYVGILAVGFTASIVQKPDDTRRQLEDAGYSNIIVMGTTAYGCDNSETFRMKFSATGATGRAVTGVICSGVLKASTIRLD